MKRLKTPLLYVLFFAMITFGSLGVTNYYKSSRLLNSIVVHQEPIYGRMTDFGAGYRYPTEIFTVGCLLLFGAAVLWVKELK